MTHDTRQISQAGPDNVSAVADTTTKAAHKPRMAHEPAATETAPQSGPPATTTSKTSVVIALLRRPEGATLDEMRGATGWQPHSTRAVLTGLRKKDHVITKDKRDGVTLWRITDAA